ncbi:type II toxin-antitoxin system RelE/ParE family toxin [Ciceribacter sp. L1K22]|uniref:type II toxin-antitoxin system RelE/ParE family toxin n=1 Tax=Ciceribacter sp. L1K22 TaxID=2820275 RepID=UPI001ABEE516|nr:type II toxin-antitoxin system RelE/ParE family toxin [Ciceribacter sp. L1K22]MBO3762339.1 type II toxin-antitoxin system RelE/ParE family toxin [Ciceribacter sp. L1K22]
MRTRLLWTPRARADVKSIYINISKEQPAAAERYLERIRQKVGLLADHPRLGERHPEIFRSARMLVEAPYVVLYEINPDSDDGHVDTIVIVRVVDGRRDLSAMF